MDSGNKVTLLRVLNQTMPEEAKKTEALNSQSKNKSESGSGTSVNGN
jgi:hypothetical protein